MGKRKPFNIRRAMRSNGWVLLSGFVVPCDGGPGEKLR